MVKADYIILGAGASGLMLAYRMAKDSYFDKYSIIIIDKTADKGNDRTWCYWEDGAGEWDDILFKTWDAIYFGSKFYSQQLPLGAYSYKMIRSESFYAKIWRELKLKSNITFVEDEVLQLEDEGNRVKVKTQTELYEGKKVFSSLRFDNEMNTQVTYPVLKQHFIGWFIRTKQPTFDDTVATFMDFDIPQKGNTRFMYILPTSKTEALFEYTLFSKDLLPREEYEETIKDYLQKRGITEYSVEEKEQGSIPMTAFRFSQKNTKNILYIGTAGGWTKASTGYTFRNTTKKTKALATYLKSQTDLSGFEKRTRFAFYDMLMLDVLAKNNEIGALLFSSLFKNSKLQAIFRFLDEESHFGEELQIMASVPSWNFIKAFFRRLF
ncbi:lycopene cyclase family protein [uncultured Winogradskyella sp.]|uniref:lycopene cyclase family protein n=1 Tax=uncultured Winogradskyella sp. TaxID=395353 RepID=UPI003512D39F